MVDLLPEVLQRWQVVEAKAREHFQRSGFGEIRTPLLESTDRSAGALVRALMWWERRCTAFRIAAIAPTLRPEGTASVVRAALQHGLLSQGTQKLWYAGPMFRYERPQAGRQRQFHQIGVEWLGRSGRAVMLR